MADARKKVRYHISDIASRPDALQSLERLRTKAVQAGFTVVAHAREVKRSDGELRPDLGEADIRAAVTGGDIIELNDGNGDDVRLLCRDQSGVCAVLSIGSGKVITSYFNNPTDTHATLNRGAYRTLADPGHAAVFESLVRRGLLALRNRRRAGR